MGFISDLFKTSVKAGSTMIFGDNTGVVIVNGKVVSGALSASQGDGLFVASLGPKTEESRLIKEFDGFTSGRNFLVEWRQGPTSAKVVASANIQAMVALKVSGGQLSIEFDDGKSPKDPVRVALSAPSLARIDVSGACRTEVGAAFLAELSVMASGASEARVQAVAGKLVVKSSGAARVDARFAGDAFIQSSGASAVEAEGFGALVAEGAGGAQITQKGGLCQGAKLLSSGAASIQVQLDGVENSYQSSGGSSIKCELASGASISGRKSGASDCSLRAMSANQEQAARKYGAAAVGPDDGVLSKPPVAASKAAKPNAKDAAQAALAPNVASVKRPKA